MSSLDSIRRFQKDFERSHMLTSSAFEVMQRASAAMNTISLSSKMSIGASLYAIQPPLIPDIRIHSNVMQEFDCINRAAAHIQTSIATSAAALTAKLPILPDIYFQTNIMEQHHLMTEAAARVRESISTSFAALTANLPNQNILLPSTNLINEQMLTFAARIPIIDFPVLNMPTTAFETIQRQLGAITQLPEWPEIREHIEEDIEIDIDVDTILNQLIDSQLKSIDMPKHAKRRHRAIAKAKAKIKTLTRNDVIGISGIFWAALTLAKDVEEYQKIAVLFIAIFQIVCLIAAQDNKDQ